MPGIGTGDWLGTKPGFDGFLPFKEAKQFAHTLKFRSTAQWFQYCRSGKKPHDVPTAPNETYKKEWRNWTDWLGHGRLSNQEIGGQLWSFERARRFVRKLGLKDYAEWNRYVRSSKRSLYIPASPYAAYGDAFTSMPDWLGTKIGFNGFLEYADAEKFARALQFKSASQWRDYAKAEKLPANIPRSPAMTYRGRGWKNWGAWLGTGRIADNLKTYRSFEDARAFVHKLKLKSHSEWNSFCKAERPELGRLPTDIPAGANKTYANKGWKGWGDWVGTGRIADRLRTFRPFPKARAFIHKLKLESQSEWRAYCKGEMPRLGQLPNNIPLTPNEVYGDKGWAGMSDWLGNGRTPRTQRKKK